MPDEAQSQGDQGQEQGGGLYDLSQIPEDVRPQVEPAFKQFDANVTREFQKRAEALNAWKPYEELGVSQIPPEELQQLLQFRELASDEGQFKDWVRQAAEQLGVIDPADQYGDGFENPEQQGLTKEDVAQLVQEALQQHVSPLQEQFQAQQHERAIADETAKINGRLDELSKDGQLDDKGRKTVLRFALAYGDDPEALDKGLADYQELVGDTERGVFQQKLGQPAPAEQGGRPASAPEPVKTFADAKRLMQEAVARGQSMTP